MVLPEFTKLVHIVSNVISQLIDPWVGRKIGNQTIKLNSPESLRRLISIAVSVVSDDQVSNNSPHSRYSSPFVGSK